MKITRDKGAVRVVLKAGEAASVEFDGAIVSVEHTGGSRVVGHVGILPMPGAGYINPSEVFMGGLGNLEACVERPPRQKRGKR